MRTHYDNLKVARNAPKEVISAAYRALAKRYHPDTNSMDTESNRILQILNVSYEVLSDPLKRAEHDRWIAACEREKTTERRRWSKPQAQAYGISSRVYVGNLSFDATETELAALFSVCGSIKSIEISKNKHTGRSKGFGFILFHSTEAAISAVQTFHNREWKKRKIVVSGARDE